MDETFDPFRGEGIVEKASNTEGVVISFVMRGLVEVEWPTSPGGVIAVGIGGTAHEATERAFAMKTMMEGGIDQYGKCR